jgi:hypothetical protein
MAPANPRPARLPSKTMNFFAPAGHGRRVFWWGGGEKKDAGELFTPFAVETFFAPALFQGHPKRCRTALAAV